MIRRRKPAPTPEPPAEAAVPVVGNWCETHNVRLSDPGTADHACPFCAGGGV